MRIYFVIDETPFFHPDFAASVLRRIPDEVVGAALVIRVPRRNSLSHYLKTQWRRLYLTEIFGLGARQGLINLRDLFPSRHTDRNFYSVRSAFRAFGVEPMPVSWNINEPLYLNAIKQAEPDVIVSSNSLIFGRELLAIPKLAAINRHSALLPAYGGVWPVLHAYRRGENKCGASVHLMDESIDTGTVLAQGSTPIQTGETLFSIYRRCFMISVDLVVESLDKIRRGDFSGVPAVHEPSYFSFPTGDHWREFRSRGGRIV